MRVLLIQPPIEDFYTTPIRFYPLGLLYTAAVFEKYGHTVEILDSLTPFKKRSLPIPRAFHYLSQHVQSNPYFFKGYYRFGKSDEEIVAEALSKNPDLIAISSQFTAYYSVVHRLVGALRRHTGAPIVLGGHHATVFAHEIPIRTPQIDRVLPGPSETGVVEFLEESTGRSLTTSCSSPCDWTRIIPAHHLTRPGDYQIGRQNAVSLLASRGCPFRCEFCSVHNMFGRRIRYRDPDAIIAEMRWNYQIRQVRIFNFEDENISFDRAWWQSFLKLVIRDSVLQDIEITAMNGLCYSTLDWETLALMRRAGFRQLNLSFVTQDERMRQQLRRPSGASLEEIVQAAHSLDLFTTVYLIIGLPEQTCDEIRDTIDLLSAMNVLIGPSVFYLPPASPLYEKLNVNADLRNNWDFYRSSAFAMETEHLNRTQLVDLFCYARQKNLAQKIVAA